MRLVSTRCWWTSRRRPTRRWVLRYLRTRGTETLGKGSQASNENSAVRFTGCTGSPVRFGRLVRRGKERGRKPQKAVLHTAEGLVLLHFTGPRLTRSKGVAGLLPG